MSVFDQINAMETPGTVYDKGEVNSVKGLHVRRYESGNMSFHLRYTSRSGRRRRRIVGHIPGTSLTEARKTAKALWAQIYLGIDPGGDWDAKRGELNVREAFEKVVEERWSSDRFEVSGRKREVSNLFNSHIAPHFGTRKLSELTTIEVRKWHQGFTGRPIGNRSLEVLSTVFNHARSFGWVKENPCALVSSSPERKRKRVASRSEIAGIMKHCFEIVSNPLSRDAGNAAYVIALALTGARPESLIEAKWESVLEVDGSGVLTFSGKMSEDTGEEESVIFPPNLMEILRSLPKPRGGEVFETVGIRRFWDGLRVKFNCPDLWLRDLRRTFASIGHSSGISSDLIGETLNQRSAETTKIYTRSFDGSRIKTTNTISSRVLEICEITQPAESNPSSPSHANP